GVSQTINILENAGYVERITTKKDRRVVYVNLTQKGQDFLKNAPRKMLDLLDKAIIKMGIEESTHFIHLMGEFSTIITELTSSSDSKDTQDKERT
ncbi:MAG: winged helix DNA-binding protein, partial [Eubacterium sp.]